MLAENFYRPFSSGSQLQGAKLSGVHVFEMGGGFAFHAWVVSRDDPEPQDIMHNHHLLPCLKFFEPKVPSATGAELERCVLHGGVCPMTDVHMWFDEWQPAKAE